MTEAIHAIHKETGSHWVGIGNLRVMLLQDGEHWFAQGLEIDYAAQGRTQQEAKNNFANGLRLTIREHLKKYRGIQSMLVPASADTWTDFLLAAAEQRLRFSQVSTHDIDDIIELKQVFGGIQYMLKEAA